MSGRRWVVTGGAGFIGSHVCDEVLSRGDRVVALDDLSSGRVENIAHLAAVGGFEFVEGTVTDASLVEPLFATCDGVIHLAAAVGVKRVLGAPAATIRANVSGTDAVLVSARGLGIPVLVASSSEVYGRSARVPFREDEVLQLGPTSTPRWGYACAKALDEFLALGEAQEHGTPVVIARLFNTVGPRQRDTYGMVVPTFVRQALRGEAITVHGDGSQTRSFVDAADVARALVTLAGSPGARGLVVNVGSDREISIATLAANVRDRVDGAGDVTLVPYDRAYGAGFDDPPRRLPDLARLRALVGDWNPRPLEDTLARVIAYERTQFAR